MGNQDGEFLFPFGIAIRGQNIYITDSDHHNIQAFTLSGNYQYKAGNKGGGSLQFNVPTGVAVSEEGRVFIADSVNNRIQVGSARIFRTVFNIPLGTLVYDIKSVNEQLVNNSYNRDEWPMGQNALNLINMRFINLYFRYLHPDSNTKVGSDTKSSNSPVTYVSLQCKRL